MKSPKQKKHNKNNQNPQPFLQRKSKQPRPQEESPPFLSRQRLNNSQTNAKANDDVNAEREADQISEPFLRKPQPGENAPKINRKSTPNDLLQRKIIQNANNQPASVEFTIGVELSLPFVQLAQKLVNAGRFGNEGLLQLREHALKRRGTVSDLERLFMAGLMDGNNQTQLFNTAIKSGNSLTFPLATISQSGLDYLDALTREAVPTELEQQRADSASAMIAENDIEKSKVLWDQSELSARKAILSHAGSFQKEGRRLVGFAEKHGLSFHEILKAMLAAASDNTSGDKVMAGTVYAIAKQARHALCDDLLEGKIKVDALIPRAFPRLPGYRPGTVAGYAPAATEIEGLKGDTIYLPTNFDPDNIGHRSAVIHELRHAKWDKAASPTAPPATVTTVNLELGAYLSQAKYILERLANQPPNVQAASAKEINKEVMSNSLYGALLIKAQGNASYLKVLAVLLGAPNSIYSWQQAQKYLQIPKGQLRQNLLNLINLDYKLPPGHNTEIEGLAGESIIDWIYR